MTVNDYSRTRNSVGNNARKHKSKGESLKLGFSVLFLSLHLILKQKKRYQIPWKYDLMDLTKIICSSVLIYSFLVFDVRLWNLTLQIIS